MEAHRGKCCRSDEHDAAWTYKISQSRILSQDAFCLQLDWLAYSPDEGCCYDAEKAGPLLPAPAWIPSEKKTKFYISQHIVLMTGFLQIRWIRIICHLEIMIQRKLPSWDAFYPSDSLLILFLFQFYLSCCTSTYAWSWPPKRDTLPLRSLHIKYQTHQALSYQIWIVEAACLREG